RAAVPAAVIGRPARSPFRKSASETLADGGGTPVLLRIVYATRQSVPQKGGVPMHLRTRCFVYLAIMLVSVGAFAQTTATLTGTVTTEGKGLPGVTVTVSSPNLQGTRTTVTGG